jgi:hypothetical protein
MWLGAPFRVETFVGESRDVVEFRITEVSFCLMEDCRRASRLVKRGLPENDTAQQVERVRLRAESCRATLTRGNIRRSMMTCGNALHLLTETPNFAYGPTCAATIGERPSGSPDADVDPCPSAGT